MCQLREVTRPDYSGKNEKGDYLKNAKGLLSLCCRYLGGIPGLKRSVHLHGMQSLRSVQYIIIHTYFGRERVRHNIRSGVANP